jgi:hypothetical protein
MKMVKNEEIEFSLGPSKIKFKVPEDGECEKQDENEVIITLASLPNCKIHFDIVSYDLKLGQYYWKDLGFPKLRKDIRSKFGFDPNDKFKNKIFPQPQGGNDIGWYRLWWRDSEGNGMDVWLNKLDDRMFRVMASELKDEEVGHGDEEKEESLHIRSIIVSINESINEGGMRL